MRSSRTFPSSLARADPVSQLALADVLAGPDLQIPTTTVGFHQRLGYARSVGCELRVHLSKALAVRSVSGNSCAIERIDDADSKRVRRKTAARRWLSRTRETRRYLPPDTASFATAVAEIRAAMSSEPAEPEKFSRRTTNQWGYGRRNSAGSNADGSWAAHPADLERRTATTAPPETDRDARAAGARRAVEFIVRRCSNRNARSEWVVPDTQQSRAGDRPTVLLRSVMVSLSGCWWFASAML